MTRRRKPTIHAKKCTKPIESKKLAYEKYYRLLGQGATRIEVYPCRKHERECWHVGHIKGSATKR